MKIQPTIHWNKLAQIRELKEFFAEDYQGFKKLIEAYIEELEKFSDDALDKFAKLRALEVTNGCTQFIILGHKRMEQAMALVKKDYETLFSPYYIERGQKYIGAYLEAFE